MRHAISIAAASSGTILLVLALFGDPATYLREARSGWVSVPANDVVQSFATPFNATQSHTATSGPAASGPAASGPAASGTITSGATPSLPADQGSIAKDTTKSQVDALQTEVTKLREVLAERGQGGTGDLPHSKDTERQPGGADKATHQETANPPPVVTTPDKGNQEAPRTAPQSVAQRAAPPAASDVLPAPAPPPAITPPAVTPLAAAPPVSTPPAPTPPAAAGGSVAEPRIADRALELSKTATSNPPDAQIAERSEATKAAPNPSGQRTAKRSEPPQAAAPTPPEQHAAERASPPESPSRAERRAQAADRMDARETASRRSDAGTKSDAATNKPAPRVAAVTPPIPPRPTPPAGNPPISGRCPAPARHDRAAAPRGRSAPLYQAKTRTQKRCWRACASRCAPCRLGPQPPNRCVSWMHLRPRGVPLNSTINPRASSITGPVVGRLRAALTELMAGRIEEARKQLQQAQLSLVFRPVGDEPNADTISAGAASVGRALGALGQNDVRSSLVFVDRATADLQHGGTGNAQAPLPQNEVAGGYAPAYPPR